MEVVAARMEEMGRNGGRARRPGRPQPRWPGQRPPAWRAAPAVQREGEQAGEKKEMEADARARARGTNGLISKIETKSFAVSKIHKMFIGAR